MIFLKAPRKGFVKTRLAKTLGDVAALRAYRKMAEKQLEELSPQWDRRVCFTPSDAQPEMKAWLGDELTFAVQHEGDLGERLSFAVDQHFQEGGGPLLLIGADCPWLDKQSLNEAFDALKHSDIAIGPTHDGGYYLLGLKRNSPSLFQGIDWSTIEVFQQTMTQARRAKLTVSTLRVLYDVDTHDEWSRAQQEFPQLGD